VSSLTVPSAPTPQTIKKQTYSFVRSYAAATNRINQIGRWHEAVCVEVIGLPVVAQALRITSRIQTLAHDLGLPATPDHCQQNVEILFTDQPQEAMDILAKINEPALGYFHRQHLQQLKTVSHPMQAWYVTSSRGDGSVNIAALEYANSRSSAMQNSFDFANVQGHRDGIDDPNSSLPTGCLSYFTSCYKNRLVNVFIVADTKALEGSRLGLIADELAMLALSQPKSLDGCNELPSVIDRFATSACPGRDPPDGLTPADTAYLKALYTSDLSMFKATEQIDIAARMAKILIKANVDAAAGVNGTGAPP
jgi:hypothetical protein